MRKDYWQKRAVKAEEALIMLKSTAETNGYERIAKMIDLYFDSVAAGEVKNVKLPPSGDN